MVVVVGYIMRQISAATLLILALCMFRATATRADVRLPLTRLVMREHVVTITNGRDGLLYSLSTKNSTVLDANLSSAQLEAKYPDVYENIRPAIASSKAPWLLMDSRDLLKK